MSLAALPRLRKGPHVCDVLRLSEMQSCVFGHWHIEPSQAQSIPSIQQVDYTDNHRAAKSSGSIGESCINHIR